MADLLLIIGSLCLLGAIAMSEGKHGAWVLVWSALWLLCTLAGVLAMAISYTHF